MYLQKQKSCTAQIEVNICVTTGHNPITVRPWSKCTAEAVGIDFLLSELALAASPQQLSCSHFVSGNTEAEAGHWSLGDEQGLVWRTLTIF